MAEIQFADGRQMVDDIYVVPIIEVTDGAPQTVTFDEAMKRLSRFLEDRIVRDAFRDTIRGHLRQWGR